MNRRPASSAPRPPATPAGSVSRPEVVILRELLAQEEGYVSGAALARKLRMSRVAVWKHMEKLREQGFAFAAASKRGYRLAGRPTVLNATLIQAYLGAREIDFTVLPEVDSTNDEAARLLGAGRATPFAVFAQAQTRGRGRFGRVWHSAPNGNLYVSFAFQPHMPPERMQTFTLWMGVNVCELLAKFCRLRPGIKWPNDILFSGRKAGGMLTEARMDADQIRDLVFGLGLNVNSGPDSWPAELAAQAVSLAEQTKAPLDINTFSAALLGRVLGAYDRFVDGSFQRSFAELWGRYDILHGQPATLVQGSRRIEGVVQGIDDEGSLLLRTARGQVERFRAGEVSLQPSARGLSSDKTHAPGELAQKS